MLEKQKLRKADIFSGSAIFLFGLWVVLQAVKMPMKGSWGGVQNVWFVSPALFPLFVGSMIMLLGALLVRTALREVGFKELGHVLHWLASRELPVFLQTAANQRFYAIAVLFLSLVYIYIPRVDFFLCSVLFLAAFITMFYFDKSALLKKLFHFYLAGTACFLVYFIFGIHTRLAGLVPFVSDWLILIFIIAYCAYCRALVSHTPELRKKYRTSLILAFAAPFIIGPIFKYFLLVPMPFEGLVVAAMDMVWYWEF